MTLVIGVVRETKIRSWLVSLVIERRYDLLASSTKSDKHNDLLHIAPRTRSLHPNLDTEERVRSLSHGM